MTYLLVVFWLGGASINIVDAPHRGSYFSMEAHGKASFDKCINMAHSLRKHFNKKEIIRIKCVPERMPK